jgi:hypothetical protein
MKQAFAYKALDWLELTPFFPHFRVDGEAGF